MSNNKKFQKIIPVGKQEFAYQHEGVSTIANIVGNMPYRTGHHPYENEEKDKVNRYELRVYNHTGNTLCVELIKKRCDIRKQREQKGKAVYEVLYQTFMSFSDLVNQIFRNVEVNEWEQEETIPDSVLEAMKNAYIK